MKEVNKDINSSYELTKEPLDCILKQHEIEIKNFGFRLLEKQRKLPFLMWSPKMHKTPSKQRFIAISCLCTTKIISSIITSCLKLIHTAHRYYCNKIKNYTGFNLMWTIHNSQEVFRKLNGKLQISKLMILVHHTLPFPTTNC